MGCRRCASWRWRRVLAVGGAAAVLAGCDSPAAGASLCLHPVDQPAQLRQVPGERGLGQTSTSSAASAARARPGQRDTRPDGAGWLVGAAPTAAV